MNMYAISIFATLVIMLACNSCNQSSNPSMDKDRLARPSTLNELASLVDAVVFAQDEVVVIPLEVSTCSDNVIEVVLAVGSTDENLSAGLAQSFGGFAHTQIGVTAEDGRPLTLMSVNRPVRDQFFSYAKILPEKLPSKTARAHWFIVRTPLQSTRPLQDLEYTIVARPLGNGLEESGMKYIYLSAKNIRLRNSCP